MLEDEDDSKVAVVFYRASSGQSRDTTSKSRAKDTKSRSRKSRSQTKDTKSRSRARDAKTTKTEDKEKQALLENKKKDDAETKDVPGPIEDGIPDSLDKTLEKASGNGFSTFSESRTAMFQKDDRIRNGDQNMQLNESFLMPRGSWKICVSVAGCLTAISAMAWLICAVVILATSSPTPYKEIFTVIICLIFISLGLTPFVGALMDTKALYLVYVIGVLMYYCICYYCLCPLLPLLFMTLRDDYSLMESEVGSRFAGKNLVSDAVTKLSYLDLSSPDVSSQDELQQRGQEGVAAVAASVMYVMGMGFKETMGVASNPTNIVAGFAIYGWYYATCSVVGVVSYAMFGEGSPWARLRLNPRGFCDQTPTGM
ncbi:unnamed protein product [Cyprideis torosa]|uniref:Uncharacterized protein n=1 Tax=Cyprideis torosa TaxID=163714 RepID=A0A7R8ZGF7_9CRUS|nr:unnamed protein product [Cyprideis torosa]CAG0879948.1 unnamed protein product [Cyprideis torosa]